MRNPKWHEDEVTLALELYFRTPSGKIDKKNPDIISLSKLLNALPIFPQREELKSFRSPSAVGLKLSNFLALDPVYGGDGMKRGSRLDQKIFHQYHEDRASLAKACQRIRASAEKEMKPSNNLKDYSALPLDHSLDLVADSEPIYEPANRKPTIENRIIRNTKLSIKVKEAYQYRCQVCNQTVNGASGPYAEGAHIKPLGKPYNGQDHVSNILCLCPNHHASFDLLGFSVRSDLSLVGCESGKLTLLDGHRIKPEFLEHHYTRFLGAQKS